MPYKQALDGIDKALDRLGDAANAAARGDQKAVRSAIFASDTLSHDANQVAFNYGLKVCGS